MTPVPPLAIDWGEELGLSPGDLLLVVLAAVGIYVAVVVLTRLTGPRPLAAFSTFDVVVGVAMGSLVGRVVLVRTSLLAGVVGLGVLLLLQRATRRLRDREGVPLLEPRAHLLVWKGRPLGDGLARAHISRRDLHAQLRSLGIGDIAEVRAAVFERDGEVTVLRADAPFDPHMVVDVSGLPEPVAAAARRAEAAEAAEAEE